VGVVRQTPRLNSAGWAGRALAAVPRVREADCQPAGENCYHVNALPTCRPPTGTPFLPVKTASTSSPLLGTGVALPTTVSAGCALPRSSTPVALCTVLCWEQMAATL